MMRIQDGIGWVYHSPTTGWISARDSDYVAEVSRLRSALKGAEIALARDDSVNMAMKIILEALGQCDVPPPSA